MRHKLWLMLIPFLGFNIAVANDNQREKKQLKKVERLIEKLQANRQNTRSQQGALQHQLENSEERINQLAHQLEKFADKLDHKQQSIAEFQQQRQIQTQKLNNQRAILAQQIRSSYVIGRRDYLKILLNQEDPSVVGRMLQYYDYFNQAHSVRITRITDTVKHIKILETEIQQQSQQIQTLLIEQTDKKQKLEQQNQKRQTIIAQLGDSLKKQDSKLQQLAQSKRHLQHLIGIIVTDSPDSEKFIAFKPLKGKLPWAVKGKLLHRFGAKKHLGNLKWQGVFVKAPKGTKVMAVANGRVEFSGWLRQLGHLLIIKHDKNYLSLYAHNRSLYKKQGDWVKTGDVVASVGNSGGQQQHGLYFELRHYGKAINPIPWFNRRRP